jgi:putative ABC transport system permease protein
MSRYFHRQAVPIVFLLIFSSLTASLVVLAYTEIIVNPIQLPRANELVFLAGLSREPGMAWPRGWNNGAFSELSVFQTTRLTIGEGLQQRTVLACLADASFFRVLSVGPERGRFFNDEDVASGAPLVAVISNVLWRTDFGGTSDLSTAKLIAAGRQFRVVGVLPAEISFPANSAIYLPRTEQPGIQTSSGGQKSPDDISGGSDRVIGRLNPNVTLAQARQRETAILEQLRKNNADPHHGIGTNVTVWRLQDAITFRVKNQFALIAVAGSLVALVALCGLFFLSSIRAAGLRKDIALRVVLGGSSRTLFRRELFWWISLGTFVSSVVLVCTDFSMQGIRKMGALSVPRLDELKLGANQAAYIAMGTVAVAMLLSIPYLLVALRIEPLMPVLNRSESRSRLTMKTAVGRIMAVAQLSLALSLTAIALNISANYWRLAEASTGIDARGVFVSNASSVPLSLSQVLKTAPETKSILGTIRSRPDITQRPHETEGDAENLVRRAVFDDGTFRAASQVAHAPGVASVAVLYPVPYGEGAGSDIFVQASSAAPGILSQSYLVHGDLPRTFGMSVRSGRWFDTEDEIAGDSVVVVSEDLPKRLLFDQPIGARIWLPEEPGPRTIVGVVSNIVAGYGEEIQPAIYTPITPTAGDVNTRFAIIARMATPDLVPPGRPQGLGNLTFDSWSDMSKLIADTGAADLASAVTAGWFAALALLLAAASAYSLFWTLTVQRQREMAIRICMGASPKRLAVKTVRNSLELAALAGIGGLLIHRGLERVLSSHIYGFPIFSWTSFLISFAIISIATLLSVLVPARSILRLSPSDLLRET